jgi:hypothetical protein
MTTGVLATPPILAFTLNNGQLAAGGSILTQVGGVNAATYQDSGRTTPLPNPIPLNSRGEVSNAAGASCQLFLTPNQVYTFTLFDASGNQIWVANYVNGVQITQSGIGQLLYPQTAAEIAASVTPVNYAYAPVPENVQRFGADATGVADSTNAIQTTINALASNTIPGGWVIFPGDANSSYKISNTISVPKRASGDNFNDCYKITGSGRFGARVAASTGLANAAMFDSSGTSLATLSYYREFKDLYLAGNAIAQSGIKLDFNQHFRVDNVWINGLKNGSGTAAGITVNGAIDSIFLGLKVHNGDGFGLYAPNGSSNFFNANLVSGCSFLFCGQDGMYLSGGMSGCAIIGNNFEQCGQGSGTPGYGLRLAGYSNTSGFLGGNYFEGNFLGDLLIGDNTLAGAVVVEGNYFNGYTAGVLSSTYTPVTLKQAIGTIIRGNVINVTAQSATGFVFLNANAGGSCFGCIVEDNLVNGVPNLNPNQIYNLPQSWVNNGNACRDSQYVYLVEGNLEKRRWPYNGFTFTLAGSSSAVRSPTSLYGAPSIDLVYNGGTCTIQKTYNIGKEFRNKFITIALPILSNAAIGFTWTATPNGTSPQTSSIGENPGSGVQKISYGLVFAPSDATSIVVQIVLNANAQYTIGHPCLYVGAEPWYDSSGDEQWYATAVPSAGTWNTGDVVWNSAPSIGNPFYWVCSAAGAPGTWKNGPNSP